MERSRSIKTGVAACVLSLALSAAGFAPTIYVDDDAPADFHTIQAAIDDANDGDTVLVAPALIPGRETETSPFVRRPLRSGARRVPEIASSIVATAGPEDTRVSGSSMATPHLLACLLSMASP
jgi:hypothetical protein